MLFGTIYLKCVRSTFQVHNGFIVQEELDKMIVSNVLHGSREIERIEVFKLNEVKDSYEEATLEFVIIGEVKYFLDVEIYYYCKASRNAIDALFASEDQVIVLRYKVSYDVNKSIFFDSLFYLITSPPYEFASIPLNSIKVEITDIYLKKMCFDLLIEFKANSENSNMSDDMLRRIISGLLNLNKFRPIFFNKIDVQRYLYMVYRNIEKYSILDLSDPNQVVSDMLEDIYLFVEAVIDECGDFFYDIRKMNKKTVNKGHLVLEKARHILIDIFNLHNLINERPARLIKDVFVSKNPADNVKIFKSCLIISPTENLFSDLNFCQILITFRLGKIRNNVMFIYDTHSKNIVIPLENIKNISKSDPNLLIRFGKKPRTITTILNVSKYLPDDFYKS